MKKYMLLFCAFSFTACIQCSKSKKGKAAPDQEYINIEKTIKTYIVYFNYSLKILEETDEEQYKESLNWSYEKYCYKTPDQYADFSYKGSIIRGDLIAKVYKNDGSFFIVSFTVGTKKESLDNTNHAKIFRRIYPIVKIPYSGEEVRLEVRRINEETDEDILLYERKIEDLTGSWEEAESYKNIPNGGGFNKEIQCHRSSGIM